jgi:hypothetical protein
LPSGTQVGVELATIIESSNGDWSGTIQGPWSSELVFIVEIYAIPARCNVIMARKITGYNFRQF